MVKDAIVIKRNIKYPRIELKTGNLVLILPKTPEILPEEFLKKHQKWIEKKKNFIEDIKRKYIKKNLIQRNDKIFYKLIRNFIKEAEEKFGVKPQKIQFRIMKTKWGSFTKKKVVIINTLVKFLPSKLVKYIVFHEICHFWFPKHSKNFWLKIEKEFPNYREYEKGLLGYWFLIHNNNLIKKKILQIER